MRLPLPKLACAGVLCQAGKHYKKPMKDFHITCLHCRIRRAYYRGYKKPKPWIRYTYLSWWRKQQSKRIVIDNIEYTGKNGELLTLTQDYTLNIDPRGHFLMFRCACIIFIDKLMVRFGKTTQTPGMTYHDMRKPFAEMCEFFANYP